MRWLASVVCGVCALVALVSTVPLPEARPETLQDMQAQLPLEVQERLSTLQLDDQTLEQVTRDKRTIAVIRQLFPGIGQTELNPEENQLAGAESQVNEVRVQYTDPNTYSYDQDAAASGGNDNPDPSVAENVEEENSDEADRNKRLINFGVGASAGGSGGGSGNFLFDIIRLVSGSGNTESSTDQAVGGGVAKDDGYGAGIPGPITRLFIIANRGIANLIQDLILRVAQTSERLVNFKARLITSII